MQSWEQGERCPFQPAFDADVKADVRYPRSVWVFLLLGMEAIRTYRSNPHLVIATYHIPTWTTPLLMIIVVAALVPNTSLLGHLCGVAVGYICEELTSLPPCHTESRTTTYRTRYQADLATSNLLHPPSGRCAGSRRASTFWQPCRTTLASIRRHMAGSECCPPATAREAVRQQNWWGVPSVSGLESRCSLVGFTSRCLYVGLV